VSGEISEMAVLDFDGDGVLELATIEPFHGNILRIYKQAFGAMRIAWEAELAFGHCLLAGTFNGVKSLLVSNRAGSRDLVLYRFDQPPSRDVGRISEPTRVVVDSGVGAANMLALSRDGIDTIFSTNQASGEIALYSSL
jgi:hypothetical protein